MYELLNVKTIDHVAIIEIDNHPVNSLNSKLTNELYQCFKTLLEDVSVHVVILRGMGDKFFIAGADIKEFPKWLSSPGVAESVAANHELINFIEMYPKPTIAFLNGMALGGGLEVAMAFDLRFAEEHVQVGLPEINLGIFPGAGGTQRLMRIVGKAKALEMMYLGTPISAEKATQLNLINQVFKTGEGFQQVINIAKDISNKSIASLQSIKDAVIFGQKNSFQQSIDYEAELFVNIFKHPDANEGINAFVEKRTPKFNKK